MRLEEGANKIFSLAMTAVEWPEVYALAKFAQVGIAYDAKTAYVAQVFTYPMSQPEDILGNRNTHAAFSTIDRLAAQVSSNAPVGEVVLQLPKEQMRQLLVMLGKAAESEDQADIIHDAEPEKLPRYPDIEIAVSHYAEAFVELLGALHADRSLAIDRPLIGGGL